MTSLLLFCAARMPPSLVPMMPSALLPVPVQIDFHFCPAAITPGISVTMYSLCAGGPAAASPPRAPPRAASGPRPPPRGAGGFLHFMATHSAYLASCGAWTPGPCWSAAEAAGGAGAGVWPNTTIAIRQTSTVNRIPLDLINKLLLPAHYLACKPARSLSILCGQVYTRVAGGWA